MKQIIVLERQRIGNPPKFRFVMWAVVPAGRQSAYANANFVSAWSGAAGQEVTDLRAGNVVERVEVYDTPTNQTIAQVEAELQVRWTAYQSDVTNNNYWDKQGTFWDGTTWTLGGLT